ncbi:MAG TPA: hypothetical protein VJG90_04480 [Candidatus Nanoarchaeia archaeon]|nr:hypothetical protein [Candidatus Nanoarchaeia archaeon]
MTLYALQRRSLLTEGSSDYGLYSYIDGVVHAKGESQISPESLGSYILGQLASSNVEFQSISFSKPPEFPDLAMHDGKFSSFSNLDDGTKEKIIGSIQIALRGE